MRYQLALCPWVAVWRGKGFWICDVDSPNKSNHLDWQNPVHVRVFRVVGKITQIILCECTICGTFRCYFAVYAHTLLTHIKCLKSHLLNILYSFRTEHWRYEQFHGDFFLSSFLSSLLLLDASIFRVRRMVLSVQHHNTLYNPIIIVSMRVRVWHTDMRFERAYKIFNYAKLYIWNSKLLHIK